MASYNTIVSGNGEFTVVSKYEKKQNTDVQYQSEAQLEQSFIKQLINQGYEYLAIHTEQDLISNLRRQIEYLNDIEFSDKEWKQLYEGVIANPNAGIADKTYIIQENYIHSVKRDDGNTRNIKLLDKSNVYRNKLQVINQYEVNDGLHENRYDVTILVNGIPLVHIELKRRGVAIKEAFNQINRYQRESFWAGSGLYEFIQIFVISNGTHTKYYSNTTRDAAITEGKNGSHTKKKTSHSFEFTSYWADGENQVILDLRDFTETFFAKHTILNILTKYCIFTTEKMLMVMRPYQIRATEQIINRINIANNYRYMGSTKAGGYIWHTTGSGKTLTSFKTAQIASELDFIDKVLFVVDRKDLDYQTMKEYDRFQKGAANGNRNTKILTKQLEDDASKIIVTTIQKLSVFIASNKEHPVYSKHIVMIFDECHRSQFGEMHADIIKSFKNYHIFGFTGTPIFAQNSPKRGNPAMLTTEQTFGDKLHTYTIVDAINDGNVLPFRIDYVNTLKKSNDMKDAQVEAIDTTAALDSSERIAGIVDYIITHFDQKTKRNEGFYSFGKLMNISDVVKSNTVSEKKEKVGVQGFNSILAAASIPVAKKYYLELRNQIEKKHKQYTIATIFSFAPNGDDQDEGILDDEGFEIEELSISDREFLDSAISDYNKRFKVNYDSSSQGFQDYYKDISLRMKNKEIDILIVVNMFLTGFDATTLNTLWVDKNLKQHGLIQAFSRTNRILNSVKTYGNIVCFRDLEEEVNSAIALFGDKDASSIVLLRSYNDYYYGYEDEKGKAQKGYEERIAELIQKYPLNSQIVGEKAEKAFIVEFGGILRLRNILSSFDQFAGNEILTPLDFQDYTSIYIDMRDKYRPDGSKENINDDLVFEVELIKQVEVNIDYILALVVKYHESNCEDKEIRAAIDRAIRASLQLRSKQELIENFIEGINVSGDVQGDWIRYVQEQRVFEINRIIDEEKLKPEETFEFVDLMFTEGTLKDTGIEIERILPPMSRFGGGNRDAKKKTVIQRLLAYFEKFQGIS